MDVFFVVVKFDFKGLLDLKLSYFESSFWSHIVISTHCLDCIENCSIHKFIINEKHLPLHLAVLRKTAAAGLQRVHTATSASHVAQLVSVHSVIIKTLLAILIHQE